MVQKMGKGINLGNTLEAPLEGNWSAPAQTWYFQDIADAGFSSVRIPVRWANHMDTIAPYAVDSLWMARVEEVVDDALNEGLVVIINSHHDNDWLYHEFPANLDRFQALWEQIARHFKDKPDELVFEIVNEPYFDLTRKQVDTLQQAVFPIIRESNPSRIVIFTGGGNDTSPRLTNYRVIYNMNIPDDPFVMAYFHYYVPYTYCQQGQGTWGTAAERQQMIHDFGEVKNWSDTTGIPVLLGEFAVIRTAHRPSLVAWYESLTGLADTYGFAQTTWCNGNRDAMATYFREPGYWDQELVNIQTRQFAYPDSLPSADLVIEAEDYDLGGEKIAYRSADSLNTPGYYRPGEGLDIDTLNGSGYALVLEEGEWAEYTFRIDSASLYQICLMASALEEGNSLKASFNGQNTTEDMRVSPAATREDLATFCDTIYLERGVQVVRLFSKGSGIFVERIRLEKVRLVEDTTNLLKNPGFELGTVDWSGKSCVLLKVENPVHAGSRAIRVSERSANWASIQQDIRPTLMELGPGYYTSSAWMKAIADTGVYGKVTVRLTVNGEKTFLGAGAPISKDEWTYLKNPLLIDWDGNLEEAFFYLETLKPYAGDFYCDDAALRLDSLFVEPVGMNRKTQDPENILRIYPNPFTTATTLAFEVTEPGSYCLRLLNLQGQELLILENASFGPGTQKIRVDDLSLPPGSYLCRLEGPNGSFTRIMIKVGL
jgi:aryl-phospho-beta-D-glucosidase BglC (GH1 family)